MSLRVIMVPVIPQRMRGVLDWYAASQAFDNALEETARAIKVDYETTTLTWRRRPEFSIRVGGRYIRDIVTNDEVYYYVNYGTRPHDIRPKNAPRLAFQANYAAKTTPRVIASQQGGSSGPVVFSLGVVHPGTEERRFDRAIGAKWEREWPVQLQRAIAALP